MDLTALTEHLAETVLTEHPASMGKTVLTALMVQMVVKATKATPGNKVLALF